MENNIIKTTISTRGYGLLKSEFDFKVLNSIKDELTVTPKTMNSFSTPVSYKIYQEGKKKLYIPKYYGLQKFGLPDKNKLPKSVDIDLKFNGELRDNQKKPVKAFIDACNNEMKTGGLINLACAAGKTVMSLYIICKLKKKTLVIVHKDFLLKQWKERIEQFLPNARVGLVKAKVIDIEDKDIVMGSLQSLAMKDYDKGTFDEFGLVICDEVHNFAAEVFSRALQKINCKHSLGLSATITRKDGLSKVFKWHLGDIVFKSNKKKVENVDVVCYEYFVDDLTYSDECKLFNNKPNMSRMINNICDYEPRTDKIIHIIKDLKNKDKDRNLLVLSDRRNHLLEIKNKLDNLNIGIPGFYVGGMSDVQLKDSEDNCDILLGTFSMASEGLDISKLDTVLLASPRSNIQQSVGRILRKKEEDRVYVPLIIDIIDYFSLFINQGNKRRKYYTKCNYNIKLVKCELHYNENNIKNMFNQGKCLIKNK